MKPSELIVQEPIGLRVLEAADGGDGIFNEDGTVNIVIQRPGAGRGPGNRIFEAAHLERDCNEGTFVGWPCFDNHDSPIARRARAGLPRPPSELTGVVRETWWDPDYADAKIDAKFGYGQGAACARVAVTDEVEALIRRIPEAIKVSVNGLAKNLSKGTWKGKEGWVVEGYVNDPEDSSIDFVTKAGAGGDVRRVLESCNDPEHAHGTGDDEELDVTLEEALKSEEFGRVLEAKVTEIVEEKGLISEEEADKRVQEAVSSQNRIRDLRDHAKRTIESAKGLGKASREDLLERFGVRDNGNGVLEAASELDVHDELEDEKVTKTRIQVLDDRLDAAMKRERDKVSEAAPTRPGGQGPSGGGGGGELPEGATASWDDPWVVAARNAGVDVTEAYGIKAPEKATT